MALDKLPMDELALLAELLGKAKAHADPDDPREFPPAQLAADASRTPNVLASLAQLAFTAFLPMLLELVEKRLNRKVEKPSMPAAPPVNQPDSRPDPAPAAVDPLPPDSALESWPEEAWADAFTRYPDQAELDHTGAKSDWAASGTPIYNDIFVSGTKGAPSNVVIRFMTGVLPQPSTVPHGTERPAPFAIEHVFGVDGTVYVLPSTTNIDGGENPIADFGHPSGGPRWQESHGWDVTVRVKPNPSAERRVTYYSRAVGGVAKQSDPKSFRIAKGK